MSAIAARYTLPAYDLVQLHYVRAIAGCTSMTAAARQLRVSQRDEAARGPEAGRQREHPRAEPVARFARHLLDDAFPRE